MKKIIIIVFIIAIVVLLILFTPRFYKLNDGETKTHEIEVFNNIENENEDVINDNSNKVDSKSNNILIENNVIENKVEDMNTIYMKVNNQVLSVKLENNLATESLKQKLKSGDIVIKAHEYGGFEKVGNLGFSLPREDTNIKTFAGDIVLYQGNQISIFYNSNSWSYTKLGKIQNINANDLKNILGNGDVTITFTLSQ